MSEQNLHTGSHGVDVEHWQEELNYITPDIVTADGIFGDETHDATVMFQHHHGLTADGIVGPHTREAMALAIVQKRQHEDEHQHQHHGHHHGHHEEHAEHGTEHGAEPAEHAEHGAEHSSEHHDAEKHDGPSVSVHVGAGSSDDSKDDDKKDDDKKDGGVSFGVSATLDLNKAMDQLAAAWHALVNAGVGVLTCTPLHQTVDLAGLHSLGRKTATLTYHGQNNNGHESKPREAQYGSSSVPIHVLFDYGHNGKDRLPISVHIATGDGAAAGAGSKITIQVTAHKAAPTETTIDGKTVDVGALYISFDINEECTFAHDSHSSAMMCIYGDGRAEMVTPDQFIAFTAPV